MSACGGRKLYRIPSRDEFGQDVFAVSDQEQLAHLRHYDTELSATGSGSSVFDRNNRLARMLFSRFRHPPAVRRAGFYG
jgi:hypothetical protein